MSETIFIRPMTENDHAWVMTVLTNLLGSEKKVTTHTLSGLIAEEDSRKVGLMTYQIQDAICEIISLNALIPGKGIGTALVEGLVARVKQENCKKVVVFPPDDQQALEFYQKRGFVLKKQETKKVLELDL